MSDSIRFSLYKGRNDAPVTVLSASFWTLANGIKIEAAIIGQSHRIICSQEGRHFTEYIACNELNSETDAVDSIALGPGVYHESRHKIENFIYDCRIEVVPILFDDMSAYCRSISTSADVNVLEHHFPASCKEQKPFTGIVVDLQESQYYTVHTYPESDFSIISRTRIDL